MLNLTTLRQHRPARATIEPSNGRPRWTCTRGHEFWTVTGVVAGRCPVCIDGKPCDGTVTQTGGNGLRGK